MSVKNTDIYLKLRYNKKSNRVCKNNQKLGNSIEIRPLSDNECKEFGHWEIETIVGKKPKGEEVLLTLVERRTRDSIILKMLYKSVEAVTNKLIILLPFYGDRFSEVFKTITLDNGSEFA